MLVYFKLGMIQVPIKRGYTDSFTPGAATIGGCFLEPHGWPKRGVVCTT